MGSGKETGSGQLKPSCRHLASHESTSVQTFPIFVLATWAATGKLAVYSVMPRKMISDVKLPLRSQRKARVRSSLQEWQHGLSATVTACAKRISLISLSSFMEPGPVAWKCGVDSPFDCALSSSLCRRPLDPAHTASLRSVSTLYMLYTVHATGRRRSSPMRLKQNFERRLEV